MPSGRVLFLDDNFTCSLETCDALRGLGFQMVEVYCAPDAFEVIDGHERLGALVTDVDLGPGPDGFEVARRARVVYPDLAVVYISGSAAGRHAAEGVPGSTFIHKPFRPEQIAEALESATRHEVA